MFWILLKMGRTEENVLSSFILLKKGFVRSSAGIWKIIALIIVLIEFIGYGCLFGGKFK